MEDDDFRWKFIFILLILLLIFITRLINELNYIILYQIVNEVQVMHKLEGPHMLKFHDWYETRNNLWLILEYCTGADLESLLKQDGYLPEQSVRSFGLDMLAGLKVCHFFATMHKYMGSICDVYNLLTYSNYLLVLFCTFNYLLGYCKSNHYNHIHIRKQSVYAFSGNTTLRSTTQKLSR